MQGNSTWDTHFGRSSGGGHQLRVLFDGILREMKQLAGERRLTKRWRRTGQQESEARSVRKIRESAVKTRKAELKNRWAAVMIRLDSRKQAILDELSPAYQPAERISTAF